MLNNPPLEAREAESAPAIDLRKGKPSRLIWRLALPAIVGLSANALYQTVDIMFLGWLGTEAVSAVSGVFPILILLAAVGEGIAVGTSSLAARLLGAGHGEEANQTATTGLALALAAGVVLTSVSLWHMDGLLHAVGVTEASLPLARAYLQIALCGYPLLLLQIFGDFLAISEGRTRFSMWVLIVAFGVNAALDPLLIFGLEMGVRGAAAATLLAQMTAVFAYIGYFALGIGQLRILPGMRRVSGAILANIAVLGVPAALATSFTALAFALVYGTAAQFGDTAVAGIGIALRLFTLGALPVFGFCLGARAVLGFAWGAGDKARTAEALGVMLRATTAFCAAYSAIVLIFAPEILSIFTASPELAAAALRASRACFLFFAFFGLYVVLLTFLQTAGKALPAALVLLAPQGYFLIPGLLILPPIYGFDGLLASQIIAAALTGALSAWLLTWQLTLLKRDAGQAASRPRS
jgi:putative MATE family efflux protein